MRKAKKIADRVNRAPLTWDKKKSKKTSQNV